MKWTTAINFAAFRRTVPAIRHILIGEMKGIGCPFSGRRLLLARVDGDFEQERLRRERILDAEEKPVIPHDEEYATWWFVACPKDLWPAARHVAHAAPDKALYVVALDDNPL
ncbi:MAG: hypothetical protein Q4B13_02915 [Lautropia sp.]|nr:hypothetical protein [Lautropia sp.]